MPDWKMSMTRPVEWFTWSEEEGLVSQGGAAFHCFSIDHKDYDNVPGPFSTAVIELSNGDVMSVPVQHIKFLDKE